MNRLAISNIAWTPREDARALPLLEELGVRGLEIAPGIAFGDEADALEPSPAAVSRLRRRLEAHGLELVSMQSLLFGVSGAALFEGGGARARLVAGLERAIALAGRLGIPNLVFGSPANRRIPDGMERQHADAIAIETFRRLGDRCAAAGTRLALEPNPEAYGTNYLTSIGEAGRAVRQIAHPAVTLNFDLGALAMNGEQAQAGKWFGDLRDLVSHVHVSEPHLAPAPGDEAAFRDAASAILGHGYAGWFSIEMRGAGPDNLERVRTSVERAARALQATRTPA
ncbi:MAG: hydroxypyruvate isomerase [Sphingomonadales bacterium]|jgi:sugar phosphate isomerase/epimerase|nr:hydroxypyruvate isomerase [Sphingomonadales bacterium]